MDSVEVERQAACQIDLGMAGERSGRQSGVDIVDVGDSDDTTPGHSTNGCYGTCSRPTILAAVCCTMDEEERSRKRTTALPVNKMGLRLSKRDTYARSLDQKQRSVSGGSIPGSQEDNAARTVRYYYRCGLAGCMPRSASDNRNMMNILILEHTRLALLPSPSRSWFMRFI